MLASRVARRLSLAAAVAVCAASPAQARSVFDPVASAADAKVTEERRSCTRPRSTVDLVFEALRFPNIRQHFLDALDRGWPRILVVNRTGSDRRRRRLLRGVATRPGFDRDEYPPAVGRGAGRVGLRRGTNPTGWMASVMYVPSSENRSHGQRLGRLLSPWCNGTRFRYVFT